MVIGSELTACGRESPLRNVTVPPEAIRTSTGEMPVEEKVTVGELVDGVVGVLLLPPHAAAITAPAQSTRARTGDAVGPLYRWRRTPGRSPLTAPMFIPVLPATRIPSMHHVRSGAIRGVVKKDVERCRSPVVLQQVRGNVVERDISADTELPHPRFAKLEFVAAGERRHSRQHVEVREATGMPTSRVQNILSHQFFARVPGVARIRASGGLEEVGVQVSVDLAVLSPGQQGRE